jgi:hypothetical protein
MRKINVAEFISRDGVIQNPAESEEDTSGPPAWLRAHADAVSSAAVKEGMNKPFDLLLGAELLNFEHDSGRNIMTSGQLSTQRPSTSPRIP